MTQVVGLTGGIASGKSAASRIFAELGAAIVDADQLAREVVAPGTEGLAQIVTAFGEGVLGEDGHLDRARLGAIVFDDAGARKALNAITHPQIAKLTQERIAAHRAQKKARVIYDAALLVESGLAPFFRPLIVVWVPPEVQLARLIARDGLSEREARERVAAQLPLEEKRKVADFELDNRGTLQALRAAVLTLSGALDRWASDRRTAASPIDET